MITQDFEQKLQQNIKSLRSAMDARAEDEQNRTVQRIWKLLSDYPYQHSCNEYLLSQIVFLLDEYYENDPNIKLLELQQHLSHVRQVHDKLYAILNSDVSIDELLYVDLTEWDILPDPIMCEFSDLIKETLSNVRNKTDKDSKERLREFFESFLEYLVQNGFQMETDTLQSIIGSAIESHRFHQQWRVLGLFEKNGQGEVHGIKIAPTPNQTNTPQIEPFDDVSPDMRKAAKKAIECAGKISSKVKAYDYKWDINRDDIRYDGFSIGLALTIGILSCVEPIFLDPYTAFTGHVEWTNGEVKAVAGLSPKLESASKLGIRRVFIPRANMDEVQNSEIDIIPVSNVTEVLNWFISQDFKQAKTVIEAKIRELEIILLNQKIFVVDPPEKREAYCTRIMVTNNIDAPVPIDIYHGKNKPFNAQIGGKKSELWNQLDLACNRVFGEKTTSNQSDSQKHNKYHPKDENLRSQVKEYLLTRHDAILEEEPNCDYRIRISSKNETVYVRQYSSGTLLISGKNALFNQIDDLITGILGVSPYSSDKSSKLEKKKAQVAAVESVVVGETWIGTDESGKGDYFGPLVGSAVFVNQWLAEQLTQLGVKDSKKLKDNQILEMAIEIRRLCGNRCEVIPLPPETYNKLYREFRQERKNLNTLLAWVHTRALENIIQQFDIGSEIVVIIDKFADESYIQDKLLGESKRANLRLIQLPKAEANIAVAAASILARAEFLRRRQLMNKHYQVDFPKGGSDPRIVEVGKHIVDKYGRDELAKVAKLHFKTTAKIMPGET